MESNNPSLLGWEETPMLTAPPELAVIDWQLAGSLELSVPPFESYVIDVAQLHFGVPPVARRGEQEDMEEIWGNVVSLQNSQAQILDTMRQWLPRLRSMGGGQHRRFFPA